MLESLGEVYGYDAVARERGPSPEERLRFHQEHSQPVMEKLHAWLEAQFAERKVEPNSGLGQAISYLLKHGEKLTLFLRQAGAWMGDLFMSFIHTCELNGVNAFDYLTGLQRHAEELKRDPTEWMPWNDRQTLARLDSG